MCGLPRIHGLVVVVVVLGRVSVYHKSVMVLCLAHTPEIDI